MVVVVVVAAAAAAVATTAAIVVVILLLLLLLTTIIHSYMCHFSKLEHIAIHVTTKKAAARTASNNPIVHFSFNPPPSCSQWLPKEVLELLSGTDQNTN